MDSLRQVEAAIRASIERSLDGLRAELADRLRTSSDEALGLLRPSALSLPEAFLSTDALAALEAEAGAGARQSAQADLLASAARIDGARSQADILRSLLAAARGHASRAALLLAERQGARGWSASGFDPSAALAAIDDVTIAWSGSSRWALAAEGRGAVTLAAADCAPLAEALSAALPAEGVLVPLVLRDRLAAVLYADRMRDQRALSVEALQMLTYLAALALETLPFRERPSTPTLEPITGSGGRGMAIWDPTELTDTATAVEPPAQPAEATEWAGATEPSVDAVEAVDLADAMAEPAPGVQAGAEQPRSARGDEVEELLFGEPPVHGPTSVAAAPAELPELDSLPELMLEPLPEFEAVDLEAEPAAPPRETAGAPGAGTGAETVRVPLPAAPAQPGAGSVTSSIDLSEEDTLLLQRSRADARAATPSPVTSPLAPGSIGEGAAPPPAFTPRAPFGGELSRGGVSPVPPPAATRPVGPRSTAEVSPPADVRGPGRAFATRPQNMAGIGGEASHEEARRLAKLLVSEIKLYNEDQIEAGRRGSDIYARLREDIERSRQMYEERVDPRVRAQNDYFQQELIRILAGGDARMLGA